MKKRVLFTLGLVSLVVFFGSFLEEGKALKPSADYCFLQDRAFTSYISNLEKMDVLMFIPETSIADTRSIGLSVVTGDRAASLNKQISSSFKDWVLVVPTKKAGDEVTRNFEKVKMLTFVRHDKLTPDWIDLMKLEVDPDTLNVEELTVDIDATRFEELQLKWDNSKTWQSYVPVTAR